jgi:hypothetical protein
MTITPDEYRALYIVPENEPGALYHYASFIYSTYRLTPAWMEVAREARRKADDIVAKRRRQTREEDAA